MDTKDTPFVRIAAISGTIAVMAGAFGAHILSSVLTDARAATLNTAVDYHFYHTLALGLAAWVHARWHSKYARYSGWLFLAGIILFSGSLYLLSLSGLRWLGVITPIGGAAFLAGWLLLAFGVSKEHTNNTVP